MSTESRIHNPFNLSILLLLSYGHLATDICQGAIPAILPFLKAKLSISYAMAGTIMLVSNLTSSVIQPLFGYLSDKKEKTFLLPLGVVCAGLGVSLLAVPDHYPLVLALVTLSGLGVASFHPEGFKTARFFTGGKMATGLSVFSVGGNLGFALGPMVAFFIVARLGLDYLPLMMVFSLMFLLLLLGAWGTVSHERPVASTKGVQSKGIPDGAYLSVGLIVAVVIMRSWVHAGLMTFIPFYYIDYLKGDPLHAGTLVSIFLLGGAIGTLTGAPVADRIGYKLYLTLSMALTSVLLPLFFVTSGWMVFVALAALGMALISSFTVTVVMAQELLPRYLGVASGLMVGFAIGTGGIGVTILGIIADHYGVPVALKSIMVLPVAGLLISFLVRYPLKSKQEVSPGMPSIVPSRAGQVGENR
jgi:MFS transporter, FSR family, fosmidomycin resistance protein